MSGCAVLLVGVDKYKSFPSVNFCLYNLQKLNKTFTKFSGISIKQINGFSFGKPNDIFTHAQKLSGTADQLIVYYSGLVEYHVHKNENFYGLSHPFSVYGKPSTFIKLSSLVAELSALSYQSIALIIDSWNFEMTEERHLALQEKLNFPNCSVFLIDNEPEQILNESDFVQSVYNQLMISWEYNRPNDFLTLVQTFLEDRARFLKSPNAYLFNREIARRIELFSNNHIPSLLDDYLINNVYNISEGSRQDALNDLEYLFAEKGPLLEEAKAKLSYLAKFDINEKIRSKAHIILKGSEAHPISFEREELKSICEPLGSFRLPNLINVPAGEFYIGSDDTAYASPGDKPMSRLFLKDFLIGKDPVTNAEYAAFVLDSDQAYPSHWSSPDVLAGLKEHPVTNVDFYDCIAYCNWLTQKLMGANLISTGQYITLPSEAEWEKASRGNDERRYPWGNELHGHECNYLNSKRNTTSAIGEFSPAGDSVFGCRDMSGNVWEWTRSLWGKAANVCHYKYPYTDISARENIDADETYRRVVRGGGYYYDGNCVTCFTRNRTYARHKHNGGGFRVILKGEKI